MSASPGQRSSRERYSLFKIEASDKGRRSRIEYRFYETPPWLTACSGHDAPAAGVEPASLNSRARAGKPVAVDAGRSRAADLKLLRRLHQAHSGTAKVMAHNTSVRPIVQFTTISTGLVLFNLTVRQHRALEQNNVCPDVGTPSRSACFPLSANKQI